MAPSEILAVQHAEAILNWYLENGVDEAVSSEPVNRLAPKVSTEKPAPIPKLEVTPQTTERVNIPQKPMAGTAELLSQAKLLAEQATSLEELKEAIRSYDGLSIKKTAMNIVFSSGSPKARVMVIGDAPEAEDDRSGEPFSGEVGQLTDKMFAAIGLLRQSEEVDKAIYLTNVLNWRPPGNRSPLAGEIELSLPFLFKHIELVNPKVIYVMGGAASKALLGRDDAITKLRGKKHQVSIGGKDYPVMASYHPTYLLKSPTKKREAWDDLLLLKQDFLQS